MSGLTQLSGVVLRFVKEHSSTILSIAAGVGTVSTAVFASKASFDAAERIRRVEEINGTNPDRKQRLMERVKLVWPLYIPAGVSAASTITCIVCSNRVELKKTLAAQTAFHVTERAYSEYRDKIVQEFGARKDQSIRDQVVADQVKTNPPPSQDILITGPGNVLCCEMFTMRYFASDMETLRKAQNKLNAHMLNHDHATLDDFYYMIGLAQTSISGKIGWTSSRLMELQFSSTLTDDGRPCMTFDYNYTHTF